MGEYDHIRGITRQPIHFLQGVEGPMLIQARHRVVDNDDLLSASRIVLQAREEERQGQRIAVTSAQRVAERLIAFRSR